jgi:hypothetical protein
MTSPHHRRALAALTVIASALAASATTRPAYAAEPGDKPAAEALFRDGRARMEQGNYAEACPKLAESQRLDPAAGTLMNLGRCYEGNNQTASAWVTFTEAAKAAAARRREDWRATALARVHALEPKLAYVVIVVPEEARAPGLVVKRDASEVRQPEWGTAIPVDAGSHDISASGAGLVPWSKTIAIADGDHATVAVPKLAAAPVATASPVAGATAGGTDGPEHAAASTPWRTIGYVALGVGAAALVTGAVTGLLAGSAGSDADRLCPSSPCANREGLDASSRAHSLATVSTIGFVAGGVLAAGGLALVIWGGNTTTTSAHARAQSTVVRALAMPALHGYGGTVEIAGGLW